MEKAYMREHALGEIFKKTKVIATFAETDSSLKTEAGLTTHTNTGKLIM